VIETRNRTKIPVFINRASDFLNCVRGYLACFSLDFESNRQLREVKSRTVGFDTNLRRSSVKVLAIPPAHQQQRSRLPPTRLGLFVHLSRTTQSTPGDRRLRKYQVPIQRFDRSIYRSTARTLLRLLLQSCQLDPV
jgi:hypothetical protein